MRRFAHAVPLVFVCMLAACSGPAGPPLLASSAPRPAETITTVMPTPPASAFPTPMPTSTPAPTTGPTATPSIDPAAGVIAACGILPIPPMTVSQTPRVLATQMVTATDGWQASSGRLGDYALSRTTDGGAHWQQVSPTGIWDHLAGPAAFLDAMHAWAALVLDDAPAPSQTARSVVFRTDDGGATWHCGEPFVPGGGIEQIIFTDSLHGQMRVRQHGTTSAEVIAMFITDDAGTHWRMQ